MGQLMSLQMQACLMNLWHGCMAAQYFAPLSSMSDIDECGFRHSFASLQIRVHIVVHAETHLVFSGTAHLISTCTASIQQEPAC